MEQMRTIGGFFQVLRRLPVSGDRNCVGAFTAPVCSFLGCLLCGLRRHAPYSSIGSSKLALDDHGLRICSHDRGEHLFKLTCCDQASWYRRAPAVLSWQCIASKACKSFSNEQQGMSLVPLRHALRLSAFLRGQVRDA